MKRETQKAIEVCAHWQGMVAPMVMAVIPELVILI